MASITDILDEFGVSYKTSDQHSNVRHNWIGITCPFCGGADDERSHGYHMGISLEGIYAVCWRCGPYWIQNVLVALTGQPYGKIKDSLKNVIPTKSFIKRTGNLELPKCGKLEFAHKRYLRNRGFDYENLELLWKIGGIGLSSKLSWRIFIPISYRGEVVSWTTRSISENSDGAKYISAKPEQSSIPLKDLLYGSDYVRHTAIVCEGPTDVWRIGPGAIALFGLVWTDAQIRRLSEYPVRVVCFDNAPDAQRRAERLCQILAPYPGETYLERLDSADPGCATDIEVAELRGKYLD